jgi:hypothetical protein
MKYRKKPVEAIQWTGNNESEIAEFINTEFSVVYNRVEIFETYADGTSTTAARRNEKIINIGTSKEAKIANKGDYIARESNGEYLVYSPDAFKKLFEVMID